MLQRALPMKRQQQKGSKGPQDDQGHPADTVPPWNEHKPKQVGEKALGKKREAYIL